MIDAQRSHVAATIDEKQIQELPLISRNSSRSRRWCRGRPQYLTDGTQPLAFGASDSRSNYTTIIDGGDLETTCGCTGADFVQDSIKEFQVITNRFDAEYGHATNGRERRFKIRDQRLVGQRVPLARGDRFKRNFSKPPNPTSISSASAPRPRTDGAQ